MTIVLEALSKTYQQGDTEIRALKPTDLTLESGQTVAFEGVSGSGKTTLLSLIAGLERPSEGVIRIGESNLNELSEEALARFRAQHIGMVFQQFHLMPHLNALENVMLALEIFGKPQPESHAKKILGEVNLGHRLKHFPNELSGGECQRVAIARACSCQPGILLADEPTGNLDQQSAQSIMQLLFSQVKTNGMSLILVTHDPQLANQCQQKYQVVDGEVR